MIVVSCPNCLSKFRVKPTGKPGFIKCATCSHVFVVAADAGAEASKARGEKTTEFIPELSFLETPPPGRKDASDFTAPGTAVPPAAVADEGKKGKQAFLVIAATEEVIPIAKFQTTFGRRNADVTLDDPDVSRQHAVVERYDEKFLLKDLESTNGTYLNGTRITIDFLEDGDVIRMGKSVVRFQTK
ncbi:MAG: FHA domain-containing protein [Acidobacteriota bacterium]